jgi:hypothetical protein
MANSVCPARAGGTHRRDLRSAAIDRAAYLLAYRLKIRVKHFPEVL